MLHNKGYNFKVPVVTDSNPHLEGLLDQHRIIYMPYSEEKNVVMELPSSPGLFFSSQLISGGELVIAFDRSLHKYWALHINQVYTPPKVTNLTIYALIFTYRVSQQVLDGKLSVKISKTARSEFLMFLVKLKGDLH